MISGDKGAALIFFAVFSVVVFGFAALAIGVYQSVSSRDDYYNVAQMTALGTLEGYFSSDSTAESNKRTDALTRAQMLLNTQSSSNSEIMRTGARAVDYPNLGVINSLDPNLFSLDGGSYYYAQPGTSVDPCSGTYPCFVSEGSTNIPINSFKLTGSITQGYYDGLVASVFGTSSSNFSMQFEVIATTVPRLGCFTVDISGSMDDQTHILRENWEQYRYPSLGHGVKSAYVLADDNRHILPAWADTADDRPRNAAGAYSCPSISSDNIQPLGIDVPTGGTDEYWAENFQPTCTSCHNFMPLWCARQTRPSGETSRIRHYANDYTTQATLGDNNYGLLSAAQQAIHPNPATTDNEIYRIGARGLIHRVETYRRAPDPATADTGYVGAEPFNSVVNGLRTAVNSYRANAVSGDRMCIVFFDENLTWTRTILPTSNFDYVDSLLDPSIPSALPAEDGSTTINLGSNFQRMVRYGIFPGYEPRNNISMDFLETDSYTNIPMALNTTLDIIENHAISGIPAVASVTLITNGITNCTLDNTCTDLFDKHEESIDQISSLVDSRFVPANIPLHVILIGEEVAPHTALLPDLSEGDCLTDDEARSLDLPYVIGGDASGQPYYTDTDSQLAYGARSPSSPWYNANAYFYNFAKRTQGFWLPLRRNPGTCRVSDDEDLCAAMTSMSDSVRWFNDPECRDANTQIQEAIEQIVGQNPFTIAELD